MARETEQDFKSRMLDQMRDLGFVINASTDTREGKWVRVRDASVDKTWEKSGAFKFDTARMTGSPVCMFKSMKRDLPTDFKRGDMSIEFARGSHEKSIDRSVVTYTPPTLAEKLTVPAEYRAEMQQAVNKTKELWNDSKSLEIAGYGYLTKPDLDPARIRQTADGKLLVPIFRPAAPDLSKIEVAGAQLISSNGFKQFIPGTKSGGGFALIPAHPDPNKWFDHLSKSDKPLVLCEGIGTAMAIHQATGLPVMACLTAKNLPAVAEWLKHEGHINIRAVKIFADNDLSRDREVDSYIGIKEACKAADLLGAKVALADNDKRGYDARDLMRDGGTQAVAELINNARTVEQVKLDRAEVFSQRQDLQQQVQQEQEVEPEPELAR